MATRERDRMSSRMRRLLGAILGAGLLSSSCSQSTSMRPEDSTSSSQFAATVPTDFVDEQVVSGLSGPTAMEFAPDGRLFVAEQSGRLRVIKNGALLATPFLQVNVDANGERGLLGVAFDPSFAANQFVYVYYTATSPAVHNRVSRFTANGDVAAAGETVLLDLNNLSGA